MRTIDIRPQEGPQYQFVSTPADIAIYGGAAGGGKTYSLLLCAVAQYMTEGYSAVLFRRTYPQIANPGGLWDEACTLYQYFPSAKQKMFEWSFGSGSKIVFRHIQHEKNKHDYQGAQFPFIGFDELTHFTESQFFYMLSRNRSTCGVRPRIRATCNPDSESWVRSFIAWWLCEDGYADLSKSGKLRWMVRDRNQIIWADTQDELKKHYPDQHPKSVTFIPASVYDNRILIDANPGYIANLMALPEIERQRLLGDRHRGGNWKVRAGGTKFRREWFNIVPECPAKFDFLLRYWDMAATEPAPGRDADWTAGVLMGFAGGKYWILDVVHVQAEAHRLEKLVRDTAVMDGRGCVVRMEMEGGSSGKMIIDHYARHVLRGFTFSGVRASGSKEFRASPLSAAAGRGDVNVLSRGWTAAFVDEMESFSPECLHDDQVDAASGAYNELGQIIIDTGGGHVTIPAGNHKQASKLTGAIAEVIEDMTPGERLEAEKLLAEAGIS